MDSPSIPDNRPHKRVSAMPGTPAIVEPRDSDTMLRNTPRNYLRPSSSGQAYEAPAFGQPAIGRPQMGPRQRSVPPNSTPNGFSYGVNHSEPARRPSIDQQSVADSVATLDLGYHSIGQPQSRHEKHSSTSTGHHTLSQRSPSVLSLDQESIGNQSLGHHSIGGPPNGSLS
jgi:hypothetical protein